LDATRLHKESTEVAIIGGGVAAAATAIALLTTGIQPRLYVRRYHEVIMAEALPSYAMRLFSALGLADLISLVAIRGRGLHNRWDPANPILRNDSFMLVDRTELRKQMLEEAQRRGAIVEELTGRAPVIRSEQGVIVSTPGSAREFDLAIDASGRAAAWSRPVRRVRHLVADIFEAPRRDSPAAVILARFGDCWAYRIHLWNRSTVVILSSPSRRQIVFPTQLEDELELSKSEIRWIGRRTAFVQWASEVATNQVLAVGDAALAHDPVSGQGVRFALASALAAAAVIRTCRRSSDDKTLALQFYDEFVATERERHLALLRSLYGSRFDFGRVGENRFTEIPLRAANQMLMTERLCFAAQVEVAPLHVGGFIERGELIRMSDGGAVRWLAGFDLLRLRDWAHEAITASQLIKHIAAEGMSVEEATSIIQWCHAKHILAGQNLTSRSNPRHRP
jgi:flavin-dependent dehydrogenase